MEKLNNLQQVMEYLDKNDFVRKNIFITLEILSLFAVKEVE